MDYGWGRSSSSSSLVVDVVFSGVCVCCVVRVRSRVLYIPRNNFLLKK
jgi:hypothetical protein